jgi:hypothetical protein
MNYLDGLDVMGGISFRIIQDHAGTGWECVDRINLAQGRNRWRDLVNTVMNIRVP